MRATSRDFTTVDYSRAGKTSRGFAARSVFLGVGRRGVRFVAPKRLSESDDGSPQRPSDAGQSPHSEEDENDDDQRNGPHRVESKWHCVSMDRAT
jgi:hypothetical protein